MIVAAISDSKVFNPPKKNTAAIVKLNYISKKVLFDFVYRM